uniref:DUF5727 domain-containing protein n=1 Tax=Schistocephalus solidus TaxID=70667 RepID=A0A0V0J7Z9_SCHSO
MWWLPFLYLFGIKRYEAPVLWGSSVVTASHGPSPMLRYETESKMIYWLDEEMLEIINGACFVKNVEVGRPCSVTSINPGYVTEIKISSVTNRKRLTLWKMSTLFAPDCVFPKPSIGEALPEVSLPLSRFMKGLNDVNITFAALIDPNSYFLLIQNDDRKICVWDQRGLLEGKQEFCQLTFRNNNREAWFNGIFQKEDKSRNIYSWWIKFPYYISVSVDWMQAGNAPEDKICSKKYKSG